MSSLQRRDMSAVELSLSRLEALKNEAGIINLGPIAAAFRGAFPDASANIPSGVATRIVAAAVRLAPDDPEMRILQARTEALRGFDGIGPAANALGEAFSAFGRHPRDISIHAANAATYLLGAIILVLLVSSLALLTRHGRLLAHDVGDLFPSAPATPFSALEMAQSRRFRAIVGSGLTRILGVSLVGLVLLLPIVMGFGLVPAAAVWMVLVLPYAGRSERVAIAAGFISVAILPLLGAMVLLPGRVASSDGALMWSSLKESVGDDQLPAFAHRSLEHPDEPWAPVILARMETRRAPMSPVALEAAAARLVPFATDQSGVVATDLANIRLRLALVSCHQGRPDTARASASLQAFERALRLAPGSTSVLRGLTLSEGLLGDRIGMEKSLQALVAATPNADLDSLVRMRALASPEAACGSPSLVMAELGMPSVPDWTVWFSDVDPWALPPTLPMNAWVMGRTPVGYLPSIGLFGLVILVLASIVRGLLPFASSCSRCQTVSCPSCNREASGFDYCPSCLFEQVKPAFLDPLDVVALQRRREQQRDWSRIVHPLLCLTIPGLGQLLAGRPLRGVLLLLVLFLAVGVVVTPHPPVIDTMAYAGDLGLELPLWPPIALAVVYLASALDTWISRTS